MAFDPIFPSGDGLSAPKYFLDGRCVPKKVVLEKGETATWEFKRSTGSVFEELVSPFIWTMPDGSIQKGNGLSSVNVSFDKVGKYTPSLNVDGNDVSCEQVQVQGIPVVVDSCAANVDSAFVGDTIKWTVVAHSESPITSYVWESRYGEVSGFGVTATMVATNQMADLGVLVSADVSIQNEDGE